MNEAIFPGFSAPGVNEKGYLRKGKKGNANWEDDVLNMEVNSAKSA